MPNAGLNRASRRAAAKAARRSPRSLSGKRLAAGLGAMGLAATGVVIGAAPASASAYVVTTLADSGPGSLREAIDLANNAAGADTITFDSAVTGTITLTTGELVIDGPLTISGPGSGQLAVSGNDESRVFFIGSSSENPELDDVLIEGLSVTHGHASSEGEGSEDGGAIAGYDPVNVVLRDIVVSDSVADGDGGGIYFHLDGGSVDIENALIIGNTADENGGGMLVRHTKVTLSNIQVSNNSAEDGGGIRSEYTEFALTDSSVSDNIAQGDGGGLDVLAVHGSYDGDIVYDGPVITNTVITDNSADNTGGGILIALFQNFGEGQSETAPPTSTLTGLTITTNTAGAGGGVFVAGYGSVDISDSTVSGNTAAFAGGVLAAAYEVDYSDAVGDTPEETLSVGFVNDTIVANTAIYSIGAVALEGAGGSFDHVTISGNVGPGPAVGIDGPAPEMNGLSLTVPRPAPDRGTDPASIAAPLVAALAPGSGTFRNTIVSNKGAASDLSEGDVAVSYSLIGAPGTQPVTTGTAGNLVGVDPILGPLDDNGGSTLTMLPGTGSPAINAGNAAVGVAPALDQRGLPRVSGAATDMGAVEVQLALVATGPVDAIRNDGESVSFTAAATGDPTITVQWQVSADGGATWTDVVGATEPTLTFTALLEQDGLRFRAVFSNGAGSVTTNSALLTVLGLAKTGAEVNQALPLGAALVAIGAAMTAFARRRRTS